jgi:hypothetical protein
MQEKVTARNEDYAAIVRKLQFGKSAAALTVSEGSSSPPAATSGRRPSPSASFNTVAMSSAASALDDGVAITSQDTCAAIAAMARAKAELSSVAYRSAHATVWMGDFNYRIDMERCGLVLLDVASPCTGRDCSMSLCAGPRAPRPRQR